MPISQNCNHHLGCTCQQDTAEKYLYWIISLGVLQRFGCWLLLLWSRNSSFYASVPQTNFHQAGMGDDTTTTCTSSTQPRNFFTLKAPGRMYGKKRNFENRSTQAYGVDSKRISFHNNSHPTCTTLRIILFLFWHAYLHFVSKIIDLNIQNKDRLRRILTTCV